MSNVKVIDFSGKTLSGDLINETAGFKHIDAWQAEGYRHFIYDFSQITFMEDIERIPLIMLTIKQSVRQLQGQSIIVKPQGFLEMFGMVLEKTVNSGDDEDFAWTFVNSLDEAKALVSA